MVWFYRSETLHVGRPRHSGAERTLGKCLSKTEAELPTRHWSSDPTRAVILAITESHYAARPGAEAYFVEPGAYAVWRVGHL